MDIKPTCTHTFGRAVCAFFKSIRLVSIFQSCNMWPIIITSAAGRVSSLKKSPGWNFTRSETPKSVMYSSKMGPTGARSNPVPRRCGWAMANYEERESERVRMETRCNKASSNTLALNRYIKRDWWQGQGAFVFGWGKCHLLANKTTSHQNRW